MKFSFAAVGGFLAVAVNANELVMQAFERSTAKFREARTQRNAVLPDSFRGERVNCVDGVVAVNGEEYECEGVDFLSFISAEELMIPGVQGEIQSSDIWGWVDTETGREITLLTLDTGLVTIDSTDPLNPCILSKHHSPRPPSSWGDVKVYKDFAYAIKDRSGAFETDPDLGLEVYDLRKLRDLDCKVDGYEVVEAGQEFVVSDEGACHNVISNTESGRIYTCGCRRRCAGGLVIYDVAENPLEPKFLGCIDTDGYTHDAQCVIYTGPDSRYFGREICIAFNEDTFTIWDASIADDVVMIARVPYDNQAYSHQGWFNYEMTKVMHDDELDEICNRDAPADQQICEILVQGSLNGEKRTVTYVWDVTDLENPVVESLFVHRDESVDHNLYVWGAIHERGWGGNAPLSQIPDPHKAYLNNYMAGVRILDISDEDSGNWVEVGFFDITATTEAEFQGAWSGYLHPSGVYAVSSIEKGIFFLDPNEVFVDANPPDVPPPTTRPPTPEPTPRPTPAPTQPPVTPTTQPPAENPTVPPVIAPTAEESADDNTGVTALLATLVSVSLIVNVAVLWFVYSRNNKKPALGAKAASTGEEKIPVEVENKEATL